MKLISPRDCTLQCEYVTVNSRRVSTLQCDTWLSDDMPFHWAKRPPYWNSTPGLDFDHITAVDIITLHQSLTFYANRITLGRKNDVMSI